MKLNPFYSAYNYLIDVYEIELDEDKFETYGLKAYEKIGNLNTRFKILKATPICDPEGGWYICKPCDLELIEAITLNWEDAQETSAIFDSPIYYKHNIEQQIENRKYMPNALYISGKYVKYNEVGDKILFTEPYKEVNILYKSNILNGDGLPLITDRECEAIADYCAYLYYRKEGLKKQNASLLKIAESLQKDWRHSADRARAPEYISQNDMNEVLDAMSSWDRHNFGRTSKPVR